MSSDFIPKDVQNFLLLVEQGKNEIYSEAPGVKEEIDGINGVILSSTPTSFNRMLRVMLRSLSIIQASSEPGSFNYTDLENDQKRLKVLLRSIPKERRSNLIDNTVFLWRPEKSQMRKAKSFCGEQEKFQSTTLRSSSMNFFASSAHLFEASAGKFGDTSDDMQKQIQIMQDRINKLKERRSGMGNLGLGLTSTEAKKAKLDTEIKEGEDLIQYLRGQPKSALAQGKVDGDIEKYIGKSPDFGNLDKITGTPDMYAPPTDDEFANLLRQMKPQKQLLQLAKAYM